MKNSDVFEFLNRKYPVGTACDFDNPGFLVGDRSASVARVLVALDCDRTALAHAKTEHCELIVTHHPVIFDGLKQATDGDIVYELIRSGIAVISMHTNLDIAEGGVNDRLCDAIGVTDRTVYTAADGFLLRRGSIPPCNADTLAQNLKTRLGGGVRYVDGSGTIRRILVCSGSGGEYLGEVRAAGCDALITADVKHNVFIDAVNAGVSLFDAGHYATEDVVIEPLAEELRAAFPELTVLTLHPDRIRSV